MNALQGSYVGQKVLVQKNYGGDWYNIFLNGKLVGKVEKRIERTYRMADHAGYSYTTGWTERTVWNAGRKITTGACRTRKEAVEYFIRTLERIAKNNA